MSTPYSQRYRASAWWIGALVLLTLLVAVASMFYSRGRGGAVVAEPGAAVLTAVAAGDARDEPAVVVPKLLRKVESKVGDAGVVVRGTVLLPDGRPAASATVTLYHLVTAWPEWQKHRVDEAITRADGAFQFRCRSLHGHLIGFEHEQFAGGYVQVSSLGDAMNLDLTPGFSIHGYVLNDLGAPVPNARVSVEAVPGDDRRALFVYTSADGGYRFSNLPAGPAHLVARHESWQPARSSALVIGDRVRSDFRFERPSMSPLRGRVLVEGTQQPIAGATVELVPINHELGLVDPIATTTAADGTFLLGGLPRGSMRMWVRHPDYGVVKRTQSIGAVAHELLIDLVPRTRVSGKIVCDDDVLVGGEVLEIRDAANEVGYSVVAKDGGFVFPDSLSPGIAEVRVLGGRFSFRKMKGTSFSLRLEEEDANEIEVEVVAATVVRGRFVDMEGRPIAGVRAVRTRLLADSFQFLGDESWQMDFSEVSGQLLQLFNVDREELLAVSGEDGRFEIRGFRPGALLARIVCTGCASRWLRMVVPPIGPARDLGDVVLNPGCSISGRVLRGGRPFVGATVVAVSRDCQSMATTGADGSYSIKDLMPGSYTVRARIAGRPSGDNQRRVATTSQRPAKGIDMALEIGRMVHGHVKSERGQPLADALVSVRGRSGDVTTSNSVGVFDIELPHRSVELVVSFGDRVNQKIVPVTATQEEVVVMLNTPPSCTLLARVAGLPSRRRLDGVLLRVTELEPGRRSGTQTRWVETPGGELHKRQVPGGRVRIEIWCDGYAPYQEERVLTANEDNDLGSVLLAAGASLRGIVRDADGNAVRDAMVLLGEETDFDLFSPSVRSAADGTFTIQGVTSRSKHMVVRYPGFAASSIDLLLPRDVLALQPLVVQLHRGTTIEVLVPRAQIPDDGLVYLRRGGHLLGSTVLDDRGHAWFANRSAGLYSVKLFGSDLPEQEVQVEPGAAVSVVRFGSRPK